MCAKFCVGCIYSTDDLDEGELLCGRPSGEISLVTGKQVYPWNTCEHERGVGSCGKQGVYHEEEEVKTNDSKFFSWLVGG